MASMIELPGNKLITRLTLANDVRVETLENDREGSILKGYPCLDDLGKLKSIIA
jgi:hypothetical protein